MQICKQLFSQQGDGSLLWPSSRQLQRGLVVLSTPAPALRCLHAPTLPLLEFYTRYQALLIQTLLLSAFWLRLSLCTHIFLRCTAPDAHVRAHTPVCSVLHSPCHRSHTWTHLWFTNTFLVLATALFPCVRQQKPFCSVHSSV